MTAEPARTPRTPGAGGTGDGARAAWEATRERSEGSGRREAVTYGRRAARFLAGYGPYNPQRLDRDGAGRGLGTGAAASGPEGPSLDAGWRFFEHMTLPRHFATENDEGDEDGEEEEAGNTHGVAGDDGTSKGRRPKKRRWLVGAEAAGPPRRTVLYDLWGTSEEDLADFGPGVHLYFKMLRYTAVLMIVAGLISLPNLLYYSSPAYAGPRLGEVRGVSRGLVGSAACADRAWVACPACPAAPDAGTPVFGRNGEDPGRTATAVGDDGSALVFRLRNKCEVGSTQGMVAFGCYLFLLVGTILFQIFSARWGKRMDDAMQTADDYTVWVRNPPEDARDPDEWRSFFARFVSDVPGDRLVSCTVVVDNHALLSKLMQRMAALRKLELLVRPGVTFDATKLSEMVAASSDAVAWWRHAINSLVFDRIVSLSTDAGALKSQIETLNEEISEMGRVAYPVVDVFVTFETEHSTHAAMKALCVPKSLARERDPTKALASGEGPRRCWQRKRLASEDLLFRGDRVLYVDRPPPPSSICWENLGMTSTRFYLEQAVSLFLVTGYVVGAVSLILWANSQSAFAASCMTSFLNLVVPMMIKTTASLESHETEGTRDASMYSKISLFRWANTVVILTLMIPFTSTLNPSDESTVYRVYSLFLTQLLFGPAVYLLDPMGHIQHHILAPRAGSQRKINLCFQGSYWTLAERRTMATTIFFLACFYSIVYPAGFFFAALLLMLYYFTDKFLLLRTWAPGPKIGGHVSSHVQEAFLVVLIIAYGIIQYFSFGGFPFDQTCKTNSFVSPEYVGEHKATTLRNETVPVFINQGDSNYEHCFQNVDYDGKDDWVWMTEGQKWACRVLNYVSVKLIGFLLTSVAMMSINYAKIKEGRMGNIFKCSDKPKDLKFSEEPNITGYVPQIKKAIGFLVPFTHPFLACDISSIDNRLVGWAFEGPERGYNLWKDFPELGHCFDIVRGYHMNCRGSQCSDTGSG